MSTISLNLIMSIASGKDVETVGTVFGLPLLWLHAPGRFPILAHGHEAANTMQIGHELNEIVNKQKVKVAREGDAYSMELYQAYQSGKKFLIMAHVTTTDGKGGITSRATLTVTGAKMIEFKRKKTKGLLGNKFHDDMFFSFMSSNSKVEYGRDINSIALEKGIGAAIGKIAKNLR